ncbi:MAG: F-type H+-transporting ATPase subunit b [Sphingobacteriales bacterium]|jgi:F-type H+-transporting ATPase subunit b
MELVTPGIGLIVWTSLTFLILMVLLRKVAWKPIVSALNERENSINEALSAAERAKKELTDLTHKNEALLAEARLEKDVILKEARELKDKIVGEAKGAAQVEADKIISKGKAEIEAKKNELMGEVKTMVSNLSIDIAEKILRKEFENKGAQEKLVTDLLKDVKVGKNKAIAAN